MISAPTAGLNSGGSYRTWLLFSICSESSSVIREPSAANRTWKTSTVHEKVHLVWHIFWRWLLKEFIVSTLTVFWGKLFHRFTTLCEKLCSRAFVAEHVFTNFSRWNRDWVSISKNASTGTFEIPLMILNVSIMSARFRLSSRVQRFSLFSLSSYAS